jgi:hypothetical protein
VIWNRKEKPYINFHTSEEMLDIIPHPIPAAKAMPKWFRKLKPVAEGSHKNDAGTVKRCMPVLDAVSQGYIIPLWADLHVTVKKLTNFMDADGKVIHQEMHPNPDSLIGTETSNTKETIAGHEPSTEYGVLMSFPEFDMGIGDLLGTHGWQQVGNACDLKKFKLGKVLLKFTNPWVIETPAGWSVKFSNPSNDWSNDISLIEGVVDTDEYYNPVNFPFVWTGNEEGEWTIPRGTPLVHIVPFKREKVELNIGVRDKAKVNQVNLKLQSKFYDKYKEFFWKNKK